jgi:NADPH:quinone reductase-like Zn-dependent oxidoreductase
MRAYVLQGFNESPEDDRRADAATVESAKLARMAELATAETLHAHVTQVFACEEIEVTFAALAAGAVGKIALRMTE